jgi:ComF family protein
MIFKLKSIHHALALNSRLKIIRSFMQQDCVLCNAASGAHMLCLACYAGLPRITNACPQCAAHSNGEICGACLTHPPTYDRAFAALDYTFPVDKLIQTLKYGHQLALAHLLGEISAVALRAMPRPDRILPMPLHPTRLRERGFNQAHEIAKVIAKKLGVALDSHLATRIVNTPSQATLGLGARLKNVKGAFACGHDVTNQHIALVDDVMTSGATLNELAKTLKQAGAREISIWVVARAAAHR